MKIDYTGKTFGKLTVIRQEQDSTSLMNRFWLCQCECGNTLTVRESNLRYGATRSCGCLQRAHAKQMFSNLNATHRRCRTKEYRSWCHAKERCYNPKDSFFPHYGGRGISMCAEWYGSFEKFLSDMGEAPSPKHSIDRLDVNGHYEPSNCRWATPSQQARNTTITKLVTMQGQTRCIADWCDILGVSRVLVKERLRRKWDTVKALTTPILRRPKKE